MNCKRCGHVLRDHVPFGAAGRTPGVCCGFVAGVEEPPELTVEDEALLDAAWAKIRES